MSIVVTRVKSCNWETGISLCRFLFYGMDVVRPRKPNLTKYGSKNVEMGWNEE